MATPGKIFSVWVNMLHYKIIITTQNMLYFLPNTASKPEENYDCVYKDQIELLTCKRCNYQVYLKYFCN